MFLKNLWKIIIRRAKRIKKNKKDNKVVVLMKKLHHIWLTVYCKPEDDEDRIVENLRKFFPFQLEDEKIRIDRRSAVGFEERRIVIFQVHLEKTRHVNQFVSKLNDTLNDSQRELLLKQEESRLDSDNHFFIRFDKDKLIEEGRFFITDKGNCYHLKMSIAAYPGTREYALKVVEEIFNR
jgi:RNA binding exosome subunit